MTSLSRHKFKRATAVTLAAVYALLTSFALDVYVLCVHQDGQTHVEISQGIELLTHNEAGSEHQNCSDDDCVDKAISDNGTFVSAKLLNEERSDSQDLSIVWDLNLVSEVFLKKIQTRIAFGTTSDYANTIKPTTVLLI